VDRLVIGNGFVGGLVPPGFFNRGITVTQTNWKRLGAIATLLAWWTMAGARAEEKAKDFPKGSDKAVKAVKEAMPKAEIDAVEQPKGFGADPKGESPLFWTVRIHAGDEKHELSVTPDGTIIRLPTALDEKDLPKAVREGLAKAAPEAKVQKVEKQETRATLRYRALEEPVVVYDLVVSNEEKKVQFYVLPNGIILKNTPMKEEKRPAQQEAKPTAGEDKIPPKVEDKKKPAIPEAARKAVKAVQELFPDAEITGVENVGYQDGTGALEILNYEVEYTLKGVEHELNITPEGVIIHLVLPVDAKDLPKKVADAAAKEIPDGKVQKASKEETRAILSFELLNKAKVVYVATVENKGGKTTVKLLPDGTVVKDVNPFEKK
jgi:hypothetical protein